MTRSCEIVDRQVGGLSESARRDAGEHSRSGERATEDDVPSSDERGAEDATRSGSPSGERAHSRARERPDRGERINLTARPSNIAAADRRTERGGHANEGTHAGGRRVDRSEQASNCADPFEASFNEVLTAGELFAAVQAYAQWIAERAPPSTAHRNTPHAKRPCRNQAFIPPHIVAKRIQREFEMRPAKTFREIDGEKRKECCLSAEQVAAYFQPEQQPLPPLDATLFPALPERAIAEAASITAPVEAEEVRARMHKWSQSKAPGPSGLTYYAVRRYCTAGALAAMLSAVLRVGQVPPEWKQSTLVLLPKKGDLSEAKNWRPLGLQETFAKLLTGVLADRLRVWVVSNRVLPRWQRAFLGMDGCAECIAALEATRDRARLMKGRLFICWLDISNAFGSVPHHYLTRSLVARGLPEAFVNVVRELYTDSMLLYRDARGEVTPIREVVGVKQGCPLSPLLFNLYAAPLMERVDSLELGAPINATTSVSSLGFADDLSMLAPSAADLQNQLNALAPVAHKLRLQINRRKTQTMAITYNKSRKGEVLDVQFTIGGAPLEVLRREDEYRYLGSKFGARARHTDGGVFDGAVASIRKLRCSPLKPWQKLKAIAIFVMPRLNYIMRVGACPDTPYTVVESSLHSALRDICGLPEYSSRQYFSVPVAESGLGFAPLLDLRAVAVVSQACRLLDPERSSTAEIMRQALMDLTEAGTLEEALRVTQKEAPDYKQRTHRTRFQTECYWSRLHEAIVRLRRRFSIELKVVAGTVQCYAAAFGNEVARITEEVSLYQSLKHLVDGAATSEWKLQFSQGRAAHLLTRCPLSGHFIRTGFAMRFCDWRFVHSARLDCLPTRGAHSNHYRFDRKCRNCAFPVETLAHIIGSCTCGGDLRKRRHNVIMRRLAREVVAAQFGHAEGAAEALSAVDHGDYQIELPRNCTLKIDISDRTYCKQREKPDLTLIKKSARVVVIVDVTVPFESGPNAFDIAAAEKIGTYTRTARAYEADGYSVAVCAFIVGALGSWWEQNAIALNALGVPSRRAKPLAKSCVPEAIATSREIYTHHARCAEGFLGAAGEVVEPVDGEDEDEEACLNYEEAGRAAGVDRGMPPYANAQAARLYPMLQAGAAAAPHTRQPQLMQPLRARDAPARAAWGQWPASLLAMPRVQPTARALEVQGNYA